MVEPFGGTCRSCGGELIAGARFCRGCGAEVAKFCANCGAPRTPQARFCLGCGVGFDGGTFAAVTAHRATPVPAPAPGAGSARRPIPPVALALTAVIVLIAGALGTGIVKLPGTSTAPGKSIQPPPPIDNLATPAQGQLTLGDPSAVQEISLDASGESTTVSAPGQQWDGLEIDVPAGAWPGATLQITAQSITGSSFGKLVTPISPLYTVSGAEGLAPMPVTLKIPATVPDGSFAMGFFYDPSGHLEGMPLLAEDGTSVTVATEHFSSAFVSLVERALLPTTIDSGFRPGVDDWQFPNYGSYVSAGHCAGQVLTEAWYYVERRLKAGAKPLHGLYDNNGKGKTPDLWQDDSKGYRLAGVAQTQYETGNPLNTFFATWRGLGFDGLQYDAFRYAIAETGEPQLVSLSDAQDAHGHAMLVYRVDPSGLHIADPNYPGDPNNPADRLIPFDSKSGTFKTYSSGVNATEVAAGRDIAYTNFVYKAKTALVDWAALADDWALLDSGKIGVGVFPSYDLEVSTSRDVHGVDVWVPLVDGYKTAEARISLALRDRSRTDQTKLSVYSGTSSVPADASEVPVTIDLKDGTNPIGLLEEGRKIPPPDESYGDWSYVDFVRLTIIREPETPAPPTAAATPTEAATGGRWVMTSAVNDGQPTSSHEDVQAKWTVDSSNGRFTLSWINRLPPQQQVETSASWGPPPASAAPGDTWTTTLSANVTCSASFADWPQGVKVGAGVIMRADWSTATGERKSDTARVEVGCQQGSGSTPLSWTFPTPHEQEDLLIFVQPSGAGPMGIYQFEAQWSYTYQWQP